MNSERSLLKRLIKLFPVKVLKDEFNSTNLSDVLYDDIIDNNNYNLIKEFSYRNINFTKQHIYIYELNSNFDLRDFNPANFPFTVIRQEIQPNILRIVFSPIVDFKVILSRPYEEKTIQFHQPFIVTLNNRHLIIQATILEKNIGTYFEENRKVLDIEKENDENETIHNLIDFFVRYTPTICDLNRGVKRIWADDRIDSKFAKWKKNRSTTTEAMDENYTLKSQYPDVYESLMSSPVGKTIFKYLIDDDRLPDHFTADPTNGELSVPLYPRNLNQIQNVINEILSNN
jgi:hypothetical protein